MRSNIDETRKTVASFEQTENVMVDGDTSEVFLRAMVEDGMDDFEDAIEDLPSVSIQNVKGTPFGLEVTLK